MLIKIKNLRLKTILGVYEWEENVDREIVINAEIFADFSRAFISDDIADTVDYDELIAKIKNLLLQKRFKLIEKMASEILQLIMTDKRIQACKLEIDKVGVVDGVDSFAVILEEKR